MPKVLHIITSTAWGGLEQYAVAIIKEMSAQGIPVEVYCSADTRIEQALQNSGITLHHAARHAHFSPQDIRRVRKLLDKGNFDVVHTHTRHDVWLGSLAAYGKRQGHLNSVYMPVSPKRDLHHWVIYNRVDALGSSSVLTNDKIARDFPVTPDKLRLLRYGRYLQNFIRSDETRASVRKALGIADSEIGFGMVGRIDPTKGIQEFAESLLHLAPAIREKVKYVVVGEPTVLSYEEDGSPIYEQAAGETGKWLKDFQQREDVRDRLILVPFQKDVIPYLNALDALVLASHNEMYSISVLDAMAMRLPVIGTDSEGTPEQVIPGVHGLLVKPGSSASIAEAVTTYVKEPALLEKHGAAAQAWVQKEHPMERTMAGLRQLYQELTDKRKKPVKAHS